MKKLLGSLVFLSLASVAVAQVPNCQINFGNWTDVNASPPGDNRTTQCTYWVLTYQVTGFSAIDLHFESTTGATAPGAWTDFSGTVATGVNPSVSVACGTVTNCTATFTGAVGWYRINFPSYTGSGTVRGTLQGYKTGYALGGAVPAGAGCPGTTGTPCVVVGNVADGSAAAGAPVRIAGKDGGGNVQDVLTYTDGAIVPAHATVAIVDGLTPSRVSSDDQGLPIYSRPAPLIFNGSTWDRQLACVNTAPITYSAASGLLQVVGLSGTTVIHVCSVALSSDTPTNISFDYGTGSNCGTGTTVLAGPFQSVLTMSLNFPQGALRALAANAFCINSSATATIGGMVTYAQF